MRALQILILDAVPSSTEATKSQKLPAASLQFWHNCCQPWASYEFSPSMWGWVKTYCTISGENERPFTTYFNVHQGTRVLICSHMRVPQILRVLGIWHSPQHIIGIEARAFKFAENKLKKRPVCFFPPTAVSGFISQGQGSDSTCKRERERERAWCCPVITWMDPTQR